jgi:hypothetical protein
VLAKVIGDVEARITSIACSSPPEGRAKWTVRLIVERVLELRIQDSISPMTVQRVLKRTDFTPHLKTYWCIPAKEDADCVARMEDVLDVYEFPYDPMCPVVCMDEKPYQTSGRCQETPSDEARQRLKHGNWLNGGNRTV